MKDYFVHETAIVDEGATIGKGTKIWHFSHIMSNCRIGENCNIGKNEPECIRVHEYCDDDVFFIMQTNVNPPVESQYAASTGRAISEPMPRSCGRHWGTPFAAVPAYALLVGNPAKQIGWMSEYGHRLHFDEKGIAECPESKQRYHLQNGLVQKIEE
ncbi:MAG: N-acetyltransferase [Butyricimonas faecihominis]